MKRISIIIVYISAIVLSTNLFSQSNGKDKIVEVIPSTAKIKLKIEDCFSPKNYPQSPKMVSWIKGTNEVSFLESGILYAENASNLSKRTLISSDSFIKFVRNTILSNTGQSVILTSIPPINWTSPSSGWFQVDNCILTIDLSLAPAVNPTNAVIIFNYKLFSKDASPVATEFNENGSMAAIVANNNIYLSSANQQNQSKALSSNLGEKKIINFEQVTHDGSEGIVYGQTVHRNEFGINKGLFWSPKSDKLAFYRMDERRVHNYPMFGIQDRPATPSAIKYPMAGDSSHTVTVGVYHLLSHHVVYLNTQGDYDQYLTNITWTPDGNYIYISWVNRDQNTMELRKYDAISGSLIGIDYRLIHPKYVEPESGPLFIPGSNTDFCLQSEADGYNHLYLFTFSKGKPRIKQLTHGDWEITEVLGFTKDGKHIIFESTGSSPLERQLYALNWQAVRFPQKNRLPDAGLNSLMQNYTVRLSHSVGTNKGFLNSFSDMLLVYLSNSNTPKEVFFIDLKTAMVSQGTAPVVNKNFFSSPNPIQNFALGKVEIGKRLVNGIDQYHRIFFPFDFDPNKKYPVVVYVYGGPHAQMITESWLGGGNLWMHYMAQQGYIVYTQDNRGSSHRGLAFENVIHRQLGTLEMADQLDGLQWLKSQVWCDSSRIGIHGWSYGGFMTTSLMTRTPGKYKVGVAGGPVIDWNFYEIMYTERYMDRPIENSEGYKTNSLLQYASKLEGRLLMIHGADDDVVVWQNSLMFVDKAVKARNVNLDYFVYPGHKHNVSGPDRVHLYKKISQYFFDFL